MPILSLFYGIIIRMYDENGEPHHTPHIHAEYQGQEASFDIDGNLSLIHILSCSFMC